VVTEIHPAAWALGGAGGAAIISALIRWALKNIGGVSLDRKQTNSEIAIHESYGKLITHLERELERVNGELVGVKRQLDACEKRDADLRAQLRKKGIL